MRSKVTEWGNSHGIRITTAMLDHLNVGPGEEVNVSLTSKGIEIVKNKKSIDYVKAVTQEVLDTVIESTEPVRTVDDPYAETDIAYLVIAINPCEPLVRVVPKGTVDSYLTLADAKEAARQIVQTAIARATRSLADLRQLGIDDISYVAL